MRNYKGRANVEIGDIIKNARKKSKLTQVDLATMLNVSQDTISSYEKGKIKVIPFEKRVKLAGILDIPIAELLYSDEKTDKGVRIGVDEFLGLCMEYGYGIEKPLIEILETHEDFPLGAKVSLALKLIRERECYCINENNLDVLIEKVFNKYRTGLNEYKLSSEDVGTLIGCITDLYMEIIQERKGSANDTAQQ